MSKGARKEPKKPLSSHDETSPEPFDPGDRDATQVLASLSRIRDPMQRYLIIMLVDRLTQGIAELERGSGEKAVTDKALWAALRLKPH